MNTKPSTDFALLVHACDRYSFLYEGFSYFFERFWDFNIPCTYYFATEEIDADINGFTNIKSGKGEWSDRLVKLLKQIPEKHIIYFQEDMWLDKAVDASFFESLFQYIVKNNWQQVKLTSSDVYVTQPTAHVINGFTIAQLDNQASGYLMSHQVTIWDKDFLLAQLPKGEHPWRNERKGTKRLKKLNPEIFQVDYFSENGHPSINRNADNATPSRYFTVSQNSALNYRVLPFIDLLKNGSGQEQSYAQQLQQHYDQQLTHDGKPKPRKDDIFKKIKNWIKGK